MRRYLMFLVLTGLALSGLVPAHATVPTSAISITFTGTGAQTSFPIPFAFDLTTDIHLNLCPGAVPATCVEQTFGSTYTVAKAVGAIGGTLTTTSAPASGVTVVIDRRTPVTQEIAFTPGATFDASKANRAIDRPVLMIQEGISGTVGPPGPPGPSGASTFILTTMTTGGTAAANTAALTADILTAAGRTLYIPGGNGTCYQINAAIPVAVTNGITIVGDGQGRVNQLGAGTCIVQTTANANHFSVNTSSPFNLRHLALGKTVTATGGAGVVLNSPATVAGWTGTQKTRIENVGFVSLWRGVDTLSAEPVVIRDNVFDNCRDRCISWSNTQIGDHGDTVIEANVFSSGPATATAVFWSSGGGFRVVNNKFLGFSSAITLDVLTSTQDFIIQGNSIEHFVDFGIQVLRTSGTATILYLKILNNQISQVSNIVAPAPAQQYCFANGVASATVIVDVDLSHNDCTDVSIGFLLGGGTRYFITNNHFLRITTGDAQGIKTGSLVASVFFGDGNTFIAVTTPITGTVPSTPWPTPQGFQVYPFAAPPYFASWPAALPGSTLCLTMNTVGQIGFGACSGGGGGGTIGGTLAATQLGFGTALDALGGDPAATWDNTAKRMDLIAAGAVVQGGQPDPTSLKIVAGSAATPITTDNATLFVSRYEVLASAVSNSAIRGLTIGAGAAQPVGVVGEAWALGAPQGIAGGRDAVGVSGICNNYGVGFACFGSYFEANARSSSTTAIAIETETRNQGLTSRPYNPVVGAGPQMVGLDITYGSPGGDALGSAAIQIRSSGTGAGRWDVGIGFMKGPFVKTAEIQSDSNADNLLLALSGTHVHGINLAAGATFSGNAFASSGFKVFGGTGQITAGPLAALGQEIAVFSGSVTASAEAPVEIFDTTAMVAGVGGRLAFGGRYKTAGDHTTWAAIAGVKENSTDGNFAGALDFMPRPNGASSFPVAARLTSAGNLGLGTTSPVARLTVSTNSGALPAPPGGTLLDVVAANGAPAFVTAEVFGLGATAGYQCRVARGTAASPTASQLNDQLCAMTGFGRGATAYSTTPRASVGEYVAEPSGWTDSAQGTLVTVGVTPLGSTTLTEALRVTGITGGAGYRTQMSPINAAPSFANSRYLFMDTTSSGTRTSPGADFVTSNTINTYLKSTDGSVAVSALGDKTSVNMLVHTVETTAFKGAGIALGGWYQGNGTNDNGGTPEKVGVFGGTSAEQGSGGSFYGVNGFSGVKPGVTFGLNIGVLSEVNCQTAACATTSRGVQSQNSNSPYGQALISQAAFASIARLGVGGGFADGEAWTYAWLHSTDGTAANARILAHNDGKFWLVPTTAPFDAFAIFAPAASNGAVIKLAEAGSQHKFLRNKSGNFEILDGSGVNIRFVVGDSGAITTNGSAAVASASIVVRCEAGTDKVRTLTYTNGLLTSSGTCA